MVMVQQGLLGGMAQLLQRELSVRLGQAGNIGQGRDAGDGEVRTRLRRRGAIRADA